MVLRPLHFGVRFSGRVCMGVSIKSFYIIILYITVAREREEKNVFESIYGMGLHYLFN